MYASNQSSVVRDSPISPLYNIVNPCNIPLPDSPISSLYNIVNPCNIPLPDSPIIDSLKSVKLDIVTNPCNIPLPDSPICL